MDDIKNYLFYDIETHRVLEWDNLSSELQKAFINHYFDPDSYDTPEEMYKEVAALHAEFSHVICVCFGYENSDGKFTTSYIYDTDEKTLLRKLNSVFEAFYRDDYALAGHNILACDNAYLIKRYIINGMKVPKMLNNVGKKPWEVNDLDSMNLWKFGMWRSASLETICAAMDIRCKSEEISGSNLWKLRIDEVPQDELIKYCLEDVESNYKMVKRIFESIY